MKTSTIFLRY